MAVPRPRLHIVVKIKDTDFGKWIDVEVPARVSYAVRKFTVYNPLATDQTLSVRRFISEDRILTFIEEAPVGFFMPDEYIASLDHVIKDGKTKLTYTKGTATTYVPDDSKLDGLSLTASGSVELSITGCLRGVPDIRLPSPIVGNPMEKIQVMFKGTSPKTGTSYLVLEGTRHFDKYLRMRLLPYLKAISFSLVANEPKNVVDITPVQYPLFIKTFAIVGMTAGEVVCKIFKGVEEQIDELYVGANINEAPLTAIDRMYPLNELFPKGVRFRLELLSPSAESGTAYLIGHHLPPRPV